MRTLIFFISTLSLSAVAGDVLLELNTSPQLLEQLVRDSAAIPVSTPEAYQQLLAHPTPELAHLKLNLASFIQTSSFDYRLTSEYLKGRYLGHFTTNPLFEQLLMELVVVNELGSPDHQKCQNAFVGLQLFRTLGVRYRELGIENDTNFMFLLQMPLREPSLGRMPTSCDGYIELTYPVIDSAMDLIGWTLGKYPESKYANIEPGPFDIFGDWFGGFSLHVGNYDALYLDGHRYGRGFAYHASGLYLGERQVLSYGSAHKEYLNRWQKVRP